MWAGADPGKVRLLLDRGANPNLRATDGSTALVTAARFGNAGAMRLLLARRADPRASANGALDLLRIAYGRNDPDMRLILTEAGIRLTDPAGHRPARVESRCCSRCGGRGAHNHRLAPM